MTSSQLQLSLLMTSQLMQGQRSTAEVCACEGGPPALYGADSSPSICLKPRAKVHNCTMSALPQSLQEVGPSSLYRLACMSKGHWKGVYCPLSSVSSLQTESLSHAPSSRPCALITAGSNATHGFKVASKSGKHHSPLRGPHGRQHSTHKT